MCSSFRLLEIFYATGEMTSSMCWHIGGGFIRRNSHRHRIFIDRERKNWLITLIKFRSKDKLYLWWMVYLNSAFHKLSFGTWHHHVCDKELDHVRTILTIVTDDSYCNCVLIFWLIFPQKLATNTAHVTDRHFKQCPRSIQRCDVFFSV